MYVLMYLHTVSCSWTGKWHLLCLFSIYTHSQVHTMASDTYCAYLYTVLCAYNGKWHLLCLFTHLHMCLHWQVTPIVPIYTHSHVHTMASDTYCAYLVFTYIHSQVHTMASDTYCAYLYTVLCAYNDKWHLLCLFTHLHMCLHWQVTPIVPIYTHSHVHTMASDTYCAYLVFTYIHSQVHTMASDTYCTYLHAFSSAYNGKWHQLCLFTLSPMCIHWQVTHIMPTG